MKKILAGLAALAALGVLYFAWHSKTSGDSQKRVETQEKMASITQGLQQFKLHNYKYPTTDQGLQALLKEPSGSRMWRGPYLNESQLKDSWDRQFRYEATDSYGFRIVSVGPDGEIGSKDDIVATNL